MNITQKAKALNFLKLHDGPKALVLPNAWDVASARIFEKASFQAIGTTSAGIAFSLGYADGEKIPKEAMIDAIRRIANGVNLPVSADIESAYSDTPEGVFEVIKAVIAAGAIGINLEDATNNSRNPLVDIPLQVEKIKATRKAAIAMKVPLVINARTDVYWLEIGETKDRLKHALQRAMAYREAGADCVFIPGVKDTDTITALVKGANGPLNILGGPGAPLVSELGQLGVARVSVGSGPVRAVFTLVERIGKELLEQGSYSFAQDAVSYTEINKWF